MGDLYASRFTHLNAHTVKCLVPSVLNTTDMLAIVRNWVTASSQTHASNHVLQFIQQSARIVLNLDQNVSPKNALTYATNSDTILKPTLVSDHALKSIQQHVKTALLLVQNVLKKCAMSNVPNLVTNQPPTHVNQFVQK